MKKRILLFLLLFCLIFSGCSIGNKSADNSDKSPKVSAAEGGVLNLSSYSPDTLNPLSTGYSSVRDFLYLVYEGLFIVNEDLTAKGVLAEGYTVSENNSVYTINLKKGIKFHNGSDFGAKDVTETFSYIRNNPSVYSDNLSNVRSYRQKDEYTVEITLIFPQANFVNNLDFPILPSGLSSADFAVPNDSFKPVGTGRYQYDRTNPYESIILLKNQSWHGETSVYIPEVCIRFVEDNEGMLYAFDSGETDLITTQRARWGEFSYTSDYKTCEVTTTRYTFLGLNTKNSVLSDKQFRKSICDAIDKKLLIDSLQFSHAEEAFSPISSKAYFCENKPKEEVKKEKNGEKGEKVSLYLLFNEESAQKQKIAEFIRKALAENNIKVVFSKVNYDSYTDRIYRGDYQMYIGEVDMSRDCDIRFMFNTAPEPVSDTPAEEGGQEEAAEAPPDENGEAVHTGTALSVYTDLELDNLISNMNTAATEEDLKLAYKNFKLYFEDNLPQIPLYHINEAMLINPRIKGKINKNLTNFYADIGGIYINSK